MDSYLEITGALRAARSLLGISQEELAGLSGISRQKVVRIENGDPNILAESVEKVRVALEVAGIVFLPSSAAHGPAVALRRAD